MFFEPAGVIQRNTRKDNQLFVNGKSHIRPAYIRLIRKAVDHNSVREVLGYIVQNSRLSQRAIPVNQNGCCCVHSALVYAFLFCCIPDGMAVDLPLDQQRPLQMDIYLTIHLRQPPVKFLNNNVTKFLQGAVLPHPLSRLSADIFLQHLQGPFFFRIFRLRTFFEEEQAVGSLTVFQKMICDFQIRIACAALL